MQKMNNSNKTINGSKINNSNITNISHNNDYKKLLIFNICAMALFGILILIGTFNDVTIAPKVYSPDSMTAKIISTLGVFPYFAFLVILLGALGERIIHSKFSKAQRILFGIICYAVSIFAGLICAGSIVDKDSLGYIFPSLNRNYPVIIVLCIIITPILLYAGYVIAKKSEDKNFVKKVICLLVLAMVAYTFLNTLKDFFGRPRYRLVVKGYDGIGFMPWYTPFKSAKECVARFGIDKGEFRSFPSGHSVHSMSMVYLLQVIALFSNKLKDKRIVLCLIGFVYSLIIMSSRMILGAHYLSDVSTGAFVAMTLNLVYIVVEHRISKES